MKTNKPLLTTENLSIGYPKKSKKILASEINLSLSNAQFITLIGINGVGKSTLLRTLTGIQNPLSGAILLKDKPLKEYDNLELSKQISIVLTERIPPSKLTVFEVIALARQIYTNWLGSLSTKDRTIINDALNLCDLNVLKNRKIDELSDGQYQKVMLARAIAQNTPIIILDEPTAHLDIINKIEIFHLLQKLAKNKNKLVICSSHEIQLCLQFATDLWLMTKGHLISDSKENILKKNTIGKVFNSDLIQFDPKTKQFIYK